MTKLEAYAQETNEWVEAHTEMKVISFNLLEQVIELYLINYKIKKENKTDFESWNSCEKVYILIGTESNPCIYWKWNTSPIQWLLLATEWIMSTVYYD